MLIDCHGRTITYLRISVTDRCNLRCVYCLPTDGVAWQPHENIMRYEEIAELVRVLAGQGINQIRLTGGEPLIRPDLPRLVELISAVPGVADISLTTNGILLEKQAESLAQAGLKRINISIDTLDPEKYARITRGGSLEKVWRGIHAAEACGMTPIKLNAVALRGINDDELVDLARLTLSRPWHMRFIELMPIRNHVSWGDGYPTMAKTYLSSHEILEILRPLRIQPVNPLKVGGPAQEYTIAGAQGRIGIISPLGEKFCDQCNRLRLTADGQLRPCLMSDVEIPILPAIRAGQQLLPLVEQAVKLKPIGHELSEGKPPTRRCMMEIGG